MALPIVSILWIVVIILVVGYMAYVFTNTPRFKEKEGFYGGVARGSGHPDCLRTLLGSAEIMDALSGKFSSTEEGGADYTELQLILSKLACLKKDLLSPSGIVEATRYQPYATTHDREPIAEVTATCLNNTIPKRDLDIIFATFRDRGLFLLRRLCTSLNMSEKETQLLEKKFNESWSDVYDVAKSRCLITPAVREAIGHEEKPYTPPELEDLRSYDGYYSGWSGQI